MALPFVLLNVCEVSGGVRQIWNPHSYTGICLEQMLYTLIKVALIFSGKQKQKLDFNFNSLFFKSSEKGVFCLESCFPFTDCRDGKRKEKGEKKRLRSHIPTPLPS